MTLSALNIIGSQIKDATGKIVTLRGVSTEGMCMVYGDKTSPGSYVPMSVAAYVGRAAALGCNAIRLIFERFPCINPARLYNVEGVPYAMPDTTTFPSWQPKTVYIEGAVVAFGGNRWRSVLRRWRADEGEPWDPGAYIIGDVVTGADNTHLYKAVAIPAVEPIIVDWSKGPEGIDPIKPFVDGFGVSWLYIGEAGTSGITEPFDGSDVPDYPVGNVKSDGGVWWQKMSADYTAAQAEVNFADWKSKVMDPAITAAVSLNMYVVVTDFDFGPAHHPLRHSRMLDFWTRMSKSQWANHPQILFELWNESEDIGSYSGGAGTWALQKPVIQETVSAIRASANNIIIVPPPFYSAWTGEATANPLIGANIAYAWHQYRSQWEAFSSNRDQITQALKSGQAIIVTEWGDDTNPFSPALAWPSTSSIQPALRNLLEGGATPAAGWFAWSLSNSWGPDLDIDAALTQLTTFGQSVQQWLQDKIVSTTPPTTIGSAIADANGKWSIVTSLASGTHQLQATAGAGSATVTVTVP